KRLRLGAFRDLDHQSALTEALFRAKPIVRATDSLLAVVSDALRAKVALTTSGPTHRNVRLLAAHSPANRCALNDHTYDQITYRGVQKSLEWLGYLESRWLK
ncbi:MAG: hypothetical protein ACXVEF_40245, partial [Polyangiales bacterium]